MAPLIVLAPYRIAAAPATGLAGDFTFTVIPYTVIPMLANEPYGADKDFSVNMNSIANEEVGNEPYGADKDFSVNMNSIANEEVGNEPYGVDLDFNVGSLDPGVIALYDNSGASGSNVEAYWPLDGNATDYYSNNVLTKDASLSYTTGKVGQGVQFTGATGTFVGGSRSFTTGTFDVFGIGAWIYVTANPTVACPIVCLLATEAVEIQFAVSNGTGNASLELIIGPNTWTATDAITLNAWHYVGASSKGVSGFDIHVDTSTVLNVPSPPAYSFTATNTVRIGATNSSTASLTGIIDDVVLWATGPSQTAFTSYYNASI